ncbi:MAG: hypothetical protein PHU21_11460, partial [Elusimicrobia bacterium]|nr:hypothetical protein [Elusimicrobiota bacterium]
MSPSGTLRTDMDAKEEATKRNRTTLYLLFAGAAILLVPLLYLLYLRSQETGAGDPNVSSHPFAPRRSSTDRIKAAQTPAPPMTPQSSLTGAPGAAPAQAAGAPGSDSLGFVKGGSDFLAEQKVSSEPAKAEAPPTQAVPAPPAV